MKRIIAFLALSFCAVIFCNGQTENRTNTSLIPDSTYDESGEGIFGRKVIFRNLKEVIPVARESGQVVSKVCIDRKGIITYAEILNEETTFKDKKLLKKLLKVMHGYKYEPSASAPIEQCGKLSIEINLKSLKKSNH